MIKKLNRKLIVNLFGVAVIVSLCSAAAVKYFDVSKNLEIFTTLYKELNLYYVDETNPGDLMKTGIDAMLESMDPYTVYYPESRIEDARFMQGGQYGGIGIDVEIINDKFIITEVLNDYPAQKAGLKEGDEIVKVGEQSTEKLDILQLDDFLKGAVGSALLIEYKRKDQITPLEILREEIKSKDVPYYGMLNDKDGYVKLTSFTKTAAMSVRQAILDLKNKRGAERLVLDLRNNGGGLLREAVSIVNFFVDRGELVVTTKGKIESWNKVYEAKAVPIAPDIPLVVLINGSSASASEIVSGALQDLDRAVIIGTRSFGKGLVQQTKDLTYNARFKLTVAKYYIPSGRCIQKLDYSNKKDGKAEEVNEAEIKPFQTRNGRTVFDGRGVSPDVEIENSDPSKLLESLITNRVIFEFANSYVEQNAKPDTLIDFKFTDEDYEAFKNFAIAADFDYAPSTKSLYDNLLEEAKKENYYEGAEEEFAELLARVSPNKELDLDRFKPEISRVLINEIARKYFYKEGQLQYSLIEDPFILKAAEVFNTNYSQILE